MTLFGLKSGQDLKNRAAHPHEEFPGVTPGAKVSGSLVKSCMLQQLIDLFLTLHVSISIFKQPSPSAPFNIGIPQTQYTTLRAEATFSLCELACENASSHSECSLCSQGTNTLSYVRQCAATLIQWNGERSSLARCNSNLF